MKRIYCDECNELIDREREFRDVERGLMNTTVGIAKLFLTFESVPNGAIDICKFCIIDSVKELDTRKKVDEK